MEQEPEAEFVEDLWGDSEFGVTRPAGPDEEVSVEDALRDIGEAQTEGVPQDVEEPVLAEASEEVDQSPPIVRDEEIGAEVLSAGKGKDPLKEALQEVDFFLRLELEEDASRLLQDLLRKYPDDPGVLLRAEELRLLPLQDQDTAPGPVSGSDQADGVPSAGPGSAEEEAFQSDFDQSLDALFFEEPGGSEPMSDRIGELEERSKTAQDDPRAQFDLAVAYREKGLLPDAVVKFERAYQLFSDAAEPEQAFRCCASLAEGYVKLADYNRVVEWADIGLSLPQGDPPERNALEYDRAFALEMLGEVEESLAGYRRILETDPGFKDVQERLSGLEPSSE